MRLRVLARWAVGLAVVTSLAAGSAPAGAATITTVNNSIPVGTPVQQIGRLAVDGVASGCSTADLAPSLFAAGQPHNLRNHTLRSRLADPVCITVELSSPCTGVNRIGSVSYSPGLVPADPLANHLGDLGTSAAAAPKSYGFTVGPGAPWSTVVHEMTSGAGCSAYSLVLRSDGPGASAAPQISGSGEVGTVLTATDATWNETPAVTRRWLRCDRTGTDCAELPGDATTHTVTDADLGGTVRRLSRATDADGTSRSMSPIVDPHVPFEVRTNESLVPGDRSHRGVLIRNDVESRCGAPFPAPPAVLQPAAAALYDALPVQSLLNEPVCLVVRTAPACNGVTAAIYSPAFAPATSIATNLQANSGVPTFVPGLVGWMLPAGGAGEVTVSTTPSDPTCPSYGVTLGADAPFATSRPALSGTAAEGAPLISATGAWSGSPSLAREWLRCDAAGAACAPIAGATGAEYVPGRADVGARLRVRVTATRGRSVSSDSEPSGVVQPAPPAPAPPLGPAGPPSAPGGAGGSPGPLRDGRAPALRIALVRTSLQQLLRRGSLPVAVTCDEPCRLTLSAQVTRRVGRRLGGTRIAVGTARAAAGRKTTVRLRLTKRARRALRTRPSLTLTFHVAGTDAAGNRRTLTRRATVRRRR